MLAFDDTSSRTLVFAISLAVLGVLFLIRQIAAGRLLWCISFIPIMYAVAYATPLIYGYLREDVGYLGAVDPRAQLVAIEFITLWVVALLASYEFYFYILPKRHNVALWLGATVNWHRLAWILLTVSLLVFLYRIVYYGAPLMFSGLREYTDETQWEGKTRVVVFADMLPRMVSWVVIYSVGVVDYFASRFSRRGKYLSGLTILPEVLYKLMAGSRACFLAIGVVWLVRTSFKHRLDRRSLVGLTIIGLLIGAGFIFAALLRAQHGYTGGIQQIGLSRDAVTEADFLDTFVSGTSGIDNLTWSVLYGHADILEGMKGILLDLNPLPTFLGIPLPDASLAALRGTTGTLGCPMPATGELFVRLGFLGGIVSGAVLGALFAVFFARFYSLNMILGNTILVRTVNISIIFSTVLSVHSPIRACSRHIIWLLALWGAITFVNRCRTSLQWSTIAAERLGHGPGPVTPRRLRGAAEDKRYAANGYRWRSQSL